MARIPIPLTPDERAVLCQGLWQWMGPTSPTDPIAVAIGFDSAEAMYAALDGLGAELEAPVPAFEPRDWARIQASVEIVFGSDVFGCAVEWEIVTGLTDAHTLRVLRGLQRKLIGAWAGHLDPPTP